MTDVLEPKVDAILNGVAALNDIHSVNGGDLTANGQATVPSIEPDENDERQTAKWQWLFSPSDMMLTPSVLQAHMSAEQEQYRRWKGVRLIFQIGDYMRLGNHATCTAAIFFHRFYMRKAMPLADMAGERAHDTYTFQEMAPTCIFLACKVEEAHRKLHGIVEATMAVLDRTPTGIERAEAHVYRADVNSRDYRRWKDIVLLHEERLLETLCFDMIVDQPHPIAIKACQRMNTSRDMAQLCIVILNSLLYGAVCTFSDAATLAACAFKKACQYVERDPNSWLSDGKYAGRSWVEAFDVDEDEVEEAIEAVDAHLTFHQERLAPATSAVQSSVSTPLPTQHVSTSGRLIAEMNDQPLSSSSNADDKVAGDAPFSSIVQDTAAHEDVRPVSRHGSVMGGTGPPPPLSLAAKDTNFEESSTPHKQAIVDKVNHEQEKQESAAQDNTAATALSVVPPVKLGQESEEEGAL